MKEKDVDFFVFIILIVGFWFFTAVVIFYGYFSERTASALFDAIF
ncbi:hypothetical protein J2T38_002306 [Neisseria perflava]|nr:hypothetical protein [Neisseria perflava]MCP1773452.1 hypothetical protein [Neisseria perflava]